MSSNVLIDEVEQQTAPIWRTHMNLSAKASYNELVLKRERNLWRKFNVTQDFDFFQDLLIARDGGFSEVGLLWNPRRWFSMSCKLLFMFTNIFVILRADLMILSRPVPEPPLGGLDHIHLNSTAHEFDWHPDSAGFPPGHTETPYLITGSILPFLLGIFGVNLTTETMHAHGSRIICVIELLLMAALVGHGLSLLWKAWSDTSDEEWMKWRSVSVFFWKTVPQVSTFSAMRLLHFVTPSVIIADVIKFWQYSRTRWRGRPGLVICKWLQFLVTRLLCLVIGFDAYLLKLQIAQASFVDRDGRKLMDLCVFLFQVMGIVQLDLFMRKRLFIFIFGGEDGIMNHREKARKDVWNAMLARAIWREHTCGHFFAIMLTFSDFDFQRLVLNERCAETLDGTNPSRSCTVSVSMSMDLSSSKPFLNKQKTALSEGDSEDDQGSDGSSDSSSS